MINAMVRDPLLVKVCNFVLILTKQSKFVLKNTI